MNRTLNLFLSLTLFLSTPTFAAAKPPENTLPLDDLKRFTTVIEQIRNYYVYPIEDKQLFESAIRGMLEGLDPHSAFFDPEEYSELQSSTSGKFGGLGIEILADDGLIRIVSALDDSPAEKAGLKANDLIVRINDTPVRGLSSKEAVDLMRGDAGSEVMLTVMRSGESNPLMIKVVRAIIKTQSVKSRMLDSTIGYIRISQFQTQTAKDLLTHIETLKKATPDKKLAGLILDVRNNPGGILDASVGVCDAFLDAKKLKYDRMIVYTEGRLPTSKIQERAHNGDVLNGAPIIVLINEGSASASEIVAGALQDHQRAIIMGKTSFGKGSVQTVLPMSDNYGLKITTALYYTPAGRCIQAQGIEPDIEVDLLTMPKAAENDTKWAILKERDLKGHLNNATVSQSTSSKTEVKEKPKEDAISDYQLLEAYNVLRGILTVHTSPKVVTAEPKAVAQK